MVIPPKITMIGDLVRCKQYVGFGREQLRILKRGMSFQGVKQNSRIVKPYADVAVEVSSRFSLDEIKIHVIQQQPKVDMVVAEETKEIKTNPMPVIIGGMTDESVGPGAWPTLDKCFGYLKPAEAISKTPSEPFASCSKRVPYYTDDITPVLVGGEHTTNGFASFHQVKYAKETVRYIDDSGDVAVSKTKDLTFALAIARSRDNNCRITLTTTEEIGDSNPLSHRPKPETVYPPARDDEIFLTTTHEKFTVEVSGIVYRVLKMELRIDWLQNVVAPHDASSFSANFNSDKTKLYVAYAVNPASDCLYAGEPTYVKERKLYNGSGYTHYFGYAERCDAASGYKSGSGLYTKLPSDLELDTVTVVALIFDRVVDDQGDIAWSYSSGVEYQIVGHHLGYVYVGRDGIIHGPYQVLDGPLYSCLTIDINSGEVDSSDKHTIGMTVRKTNNPTKTEYDFCGIFSQEKNPEEETVVENETRNYSWNVNAALQPCSASVVGEGCSDKSGGGVFCCIDDPYLWSGIWCRGYPANRTCVNNRDGYTIHEGSRTQVVTAFNFSDLELVEGIRWEYVNKWKVYQEADHIGDYGDDHCIDPWTATRDCSVDQSLSWNECWAWGCGGTLTSREYRQGDDFSVEIHDVNEIGSGYTGYPNDGDFFLPYGTTLWPTIAMPGNHWNEGHFISGESVISEKLEYTVHIPFKINNATGVSSFVSADNNISDSFLYGMLFEGIVYSDESVESRQTKIKVRFNNEDITSNVLDITGHSVFTLGYIGFLF